MIASSNEKKMGRENRKPRVFRMNEEEYAEICKAAEVAGYSSTSSYLRHTLHFFSRLVLSGEFVIVSPEVSQCRLEK
jgi:hypothetical protein